MNRFIKYATITLILTYPTLLIDEYRMFFNIALDHVNDFSPTHYFYYKKVYKYLNRYEYALKNRLPNNLEPNDRYKNCIWSMWLQGEEKAPGIVKNCLKSIKKYCAGRQVIILTENSIDKYIQLPSYIIRKYKNGQIPPALYSDIVRYCLIYKYGGTWIDSTVLLTDKLPNEILHQDFFMFQISKFRPIRYFHLTTNWFIHAKPGNVIIKDLINLNFEYWKNKDFACDYFMNFAFFTISVKMDKEAKKIFDKMPYVKEQCHFFSYLTKPYKKNLFESLKRYSGYPIHKLTYRKRLYVLRPYELWDEESSLLHFLEQGNALGY